MTEILAPWFANVLEMQSPVDAVTQLSEALMHSDVPVGDLDALTLRLWHRFKGDLTACIENCLVDEFEEGLIGSQLSRTIVMVKWHVVFRQSLINAHKRIVAGHITELLSEKDSSECAKPELDEWLHIKLYKFAQSLFPEEGFKENTWQELRLIAINNLAEARSQQLFEMVTEYPDSIPGLKELGECVKQANSVAAIGKRFRVSLQKRLLHMGASTSQILDFYVSMIKALRLLDPSDTLLSFVAVPVRKYLLTRKDAVRCIVASLTEGKESELHGELKQGGNLAYAADEDDEENGPGAHWEPNKRNKELVQPSAEGASKGLDTLAMLVSIYGSTDLFIVEFRSLLADKLISNVTYATDNEVANLELLKIRFGEESLHSCEVMLKDMEDSKRANNAIFSELSRRTPQASSSSSRTPTQNPRGATSGEEKTVDYVIVSEHYWPSMPRDGMAHHPQAAALLQRYHDTYATLKKPRKLHPAHTLGQVELQLDFADGSERTFLVSPLQANVILHFQEEDSATEGATGPCTLSLRRLAEMCEVEEEEILNSGVAYWVSKGVLKEVTAAEAGPAAAAGTAGDAAYLGYDEGPDRFFQVVEAQEMLAAMDMSVSGDDAMGNQGSKLASAAGAEQKAALAQIESYVRGLLAGQGKMSLERLHGMLRLIASGGAGAGGASAGDLRFDMTPPQLRQFLQGLEDAGKVEFIEGTYALCPSAAGAER